MLPILTLVLIGPVISKDHLENSRLYSIRCRRRGKSNHGWQKNKIQGYENGYFLGPTLFDNVNDTMKIYQEEIFGPFVYLGQKL